MALTSLTNLQPLHVHSVGISTFDGSVSVGGTLTYEDVTNVDAIGIITARSGVNVSGGQLDVGSSIKLGNAGVVTATTFVGALTGNIAGNATGLSGTPNISVGTISGSTGTFSGDVSIADKIIHTGDTNTAIRFPADDTFTVETNNTERFRIGSNGYIGVGDFSSKSRTDPLNVDSGIGTCNIGGNYIHLKRYSGGGTNYITAPQNNANLYISADDHIVFGVDHSSSIYSHNTEALRIDSSGLITLKETLIFNGSEFYPVSGIGSNVGHRLNYRRNPIESRTNTGSLSQRYYKIGHIVLNGSESAEINIYGTVGYSAGQEVAGKTTIIMRATNGGTLVGFWYEESLGQINLSDVRWKYTGSNNVYQLWVQANNYSNIAPFVRCTGNGYTSFNEDTGSNTAPSGSTSFSTYNRKVVGTTATIRYNPTDTTFNRNIKMASGYGIDFSSASGSAVGSSSAVLDDYEEGSFTAILRSHSNPGNTGYNYDTSNNFTSYYTRIGNIVYVSISLSNLHSSPDLRNHQLIRVEGLPFTTARRCGLAVVDGRGIYPRWSTDSQTTNAATTTVWANGNDTMFYLQFYMHFTPYTAWATVHNDTSSQRWHLAGCYPVA